MQIIINSFKTDIAHCSAVVADYTHWCSDNTANINVTVRKAACNCRARNKYDEVLQLRGLTACH